MRLIEQLSLPQGLRDLDSARLQQVADEVRAESSSHLAHRWAPRRQLGRGGITVALMRNCRRGG